MIPTIIQQQLAALRQRERLLQITWGVARWLALVVGAIFLFCMLDYVVDRFEETPWGLRRTLFFVLVVLAAAGAIFFLFRPIGSKLDDEELALWVEEGNPRLHHRLISAVQLNQEGAIVEGMSRELIVVVTREAEQQAKELDFPRLADHRRLKHSAALVVPALLLAAVPLLLAPQLCGILLGRLFLSDLEIPHRVTMVNDTTEVWPMGEAVFLKVRARGQNDQDKGYLVVDQDGIRDNYALEGGETDPKSGDTLYRVEIPASSSDFSFLAYLGDGRLHTPGQIRFVSRPVVEKQFAWTLLPPYCDPDPNGNPYEIEQPRGEVVGINDSSVRVKVKLQKPVVRVDLEILDTGDPAAEDTARQEKLMRTVPMAVTPSPDGKDSEGVWAEAVFTMKSGETAYRIVAEDKYGFRNQPPPRRSLRIIPEEPPTVTLLREQFGSLENVAGLTVEEDADLEGLPLPSGGALRIAYSSSGPYGLGRARLKYRLLKKRDSGNEDAGEEKWQHYNLTEYKAGKGVGLFDPRRGTFEFAKGNVEFHAVPSLEPYRIPGRLVGGGRFDFQTKEAVFDSKDKLTTPKEGDQFEYCIEVFASRDPKSSRPFAQSETRVKNVVSVSELLLWLSSTANEEQRIRQLNTRQEDVFQKRK